MKAGHERAVNRTAANVVARGESFEFEPLDSDRDSRLPIPFTEPTEQHSKNPCFKDLTGARFGRLVVLGLAKEVAKRWVCRCVCGTYVVRKSKAVKAAAEDASCSQCYLLARAKADDYFRRTGRHLEKVEFMR